MGSDDFRVKKTRNNSRNNPRNNPEKQNCSAKLFRGTVPGCSAPCSARKGSGNNELRKNGTAEQSKHANPPTPPSTRASLKASRAARERVRARSRFFVPRAEKGAGNFHGSYLKPDCQDGALEPRGQWQSFTRLSGFFQGRAPSSWPTRNTTPIGRGAPVAHVAFRRAGRPDLRPGRALAPLGQTVANGTPWRAPRGFAPATAPRCWSPAIRDGFSITR